MLPVNWQRIDQPKGAIHGLKIAVRCCNIMPHGADSRHPRKLHRSIALQIAGQRYASQQTASRTLHIALYAGHLTRKIALRTGNHFKVGI